MKVGKRLGWIGVATGILAAAWVSGCQSQPGATDADGNQTATYRRRVLTTDLPGDVRVPAVAAAAEMSLRRRGYSVTKTGTEDYSRIEGEAPKAGWLERVVIRTRQTGSRTRIEIIAQPLGDQVLSRAILSDMMGALGVSTHAVENQNENGSPVSGR